MSFDRHFVWLTALSFLSDPTMGMHELAALPRLPEKNFPLPDKLPRCGETLSVTQLG